MRLALLSFFTLIHLFLSAQTTLRDAFATRTQVVPKIDGKINDACWNEAKVNTDFITVQPAYGKPSAFKTETRVLYDNTALYIAAYLFDNEPTKIYTDITERDNLGRADRFELGLDTYNDDLNGYKLIVSAANVQFDGRHLSGDFDDSWDGVWQSNVSINVDGWSVEMRIPFSMIRFPKKEVQDWGIQFVRMVSRTGELSTWSPVNPKIDGIVNQWGNLKGVEGVKPPLRLALSPYVAGYSDNVPITYNPASYNQSFSYNGGMDIKYGVNESYTIDATLIPDFGQVQSDNIVRNLSPFEVRYDERRPFFTEGTELFNRGEIFYSRRIGARPRNYLYGDEIASEEEIVRNPAHSQLYNATKFSGRNNNKTGIGILNAIAAPTFAVVRNKLTGVERKVQTDVLTNYNVLVVDQLLKNYSSISLTNTNVWRDGSERDANVTAASFSLRDKTNTYEIKGLGAVSKLWDSQLTNKEQLGMNYNIGFNKVSGLWQYELAHGIVGRYFNPNDLGLLFNNNIINNALTVRYFDFNATPKRNYWLSEMSFNYINRYNPTSFQELKMSAFTEYQMKNFSSITFATESELTYYNDYYEPRTFGRKFNRVPFYFGMLRYQSDTRKKYVFNFALLGAESPIPNDPYYGFDFGTTLNFVKKFRINFQSMVRFDHKSFGFVTNIDENIVIGSRDIKTVDNILTINYAFNSKANIVWRIRHYWNLINYLDFYNLNQDGTLAKRDFLDGNNENFNAFNSDFVFTYQFAPGSFINLIWKNGLQETQYQGTGNYVKSLRYLSDTPKANQFAIKAIYYLDYNSWFGKKK